MSYYDEYSWPLVFLKKIFFCYHTVFRLCTHLENLRVGTTETGHRLRQEKLEQAYGGSDQSHRQ